jgi:hypothetical protein
MSAYISASDAATWLTAHVTFIDEWTAATTKQAAALEEASDHIDTLLLRGHKYDPAQAREFPRYPEKASYAGMPDSDYFWYNYGIPDYSIVPQCVKDACCLEALAILEWGNSFRRKNQEQGVKQIQLGSGSGLTESYGAHGILLSEKARAKLKEWIAGTVGAV